VEKSVKNKLKLLLKGYIAPAAVLWLVYYSVLSAFFVELFGFSAARAQYVKEIFSEPEAHKISPADLVVIGDSTAKSAVNPLAVNYAFTLNLGVNAGTALTSYAVLKRYLQQFPKPKCVLYIAQYNWERNYGDFFPKVLFYDTYDWRDLPSMWLTGKREGIFPADQYTTAGFFINALRTELRINELPVNLMQERIFRWWEGRGNKWRKARREMVKLRGFQNNDVRRLLPEDEFFKVETHSALLASFRAYPAEDFYLRALIDLAEREQVRLIYAFLPLAESENTEAATPHRMVRDAHMRAIFGRKGIELFLPSTYPRQHFYDFTHLSPEGAVHFQPFLDPTLSQWCSAEAR